MRSPWRPALGYVYALLIVVVAIWSRSMIHPYVGDRVAFAFLLPGVLVVSVLWGIGPALVAILVGWGASIWMFLSHGGTLYVDNFSSQVSLVASTMIALAIAIVGDSFKRAREQARGYERLLGDDFKQTGHIFVTTPSSIESLSTPIPPAGSVPLGGALSRIICEVIPQIPEAADARSWQVFADGCLVVDVEISRDPGPGAGVHGKWVVTFVNPNSKVAAKPGETTPNRLRNISWN